MKSHYQSASGFIIDSTRELFAKKGIKVSKLSQRIGDALRDYHQPDQYICSTAEADISIPYVGIAGGSTLYVLVGGGICSERSLASIGVPLAALGHSVLSFANIFNAGCMISDVPAVRQAVYRSDRAAGRFSYEARLYANMLSDLIRTHFPDIRSLIIVSHSAGACIAAQIISELRQTKPETYRLISDTFSVTPAGMFKDNISRIRRLWYSLKIAVTISLETLSIHPALQRNNHSWLLLIKDSGSWTRDIRDFLRMPLRCVNAMQEQLMSDTSIRHTIFTTSRDHVFPIKQAQELIKKHRNAILTILNGNHVNILPLGAELALAMHKPEGHKKASTWLNSAL
ncbi:MAG: Alpha/beta hydrolase family protein [candidate division WS6 bacterium OLB20]|uniref:Alpha/beta hydrolase family protein n=1 Tax=candidate division WS6 bacterium OLB20 TaxID=1617426 RepID=A0A136LXQ7_9BACT|nr:MAG: Alpha/beta hydrolase family protein [candidate division WS6 bacterium OLB20]